VSTSILFQKILLFGCSYLRMVLSIEVKGIRQGEQIPVEFTCDGNNRSPEVKIENPPSGTRSLALIMEDPDAPVGLFVHWVLINIGPEVTQIKGDMGKSIRTREGFVQGKNDFGKIGYDGPCPPRGHGFHRYYFKLYALSSSLNVTEPVTREKVVKAMEGKVLGQAEVIGRYKRD
jgi:Raf kinase inhibitor-like YbhB/YbcL family protein